MSENEKVEMPVSLVNAILGVLQELPAKSVLNIINAVLALQKPGAPVAPVVEPAPSA